MLVLTRKKDERIVVPLIDGTAIEFCVVEIRGDKVRIGIEAPKSIRVDRKEVHEARIRKGDDEELPRSEGAVSQCVENDCDRPFVLAQDDGRGG